MIPLRISNPPTLRRYHLDGTLNSNVLANGNTLAYLAYSVRQSLCKSLEILGEIFKTPRNMKNAPRRMDKLFNTIFDIFELSFSVTIVLAHWILFVFLLFQTRNNLWSCS